MAYRCNLSSWDNSISKIKTEESNFHIIFASSMAYLNTWDPVSENKTEKRRCNQASHLLKDQCVLYAHTLSILGISSHCKFWYLYMQLDGLDIVFFSPQECDMVFWFLASATWDFVFLYLRRKCGVHIDFGKMTRQELSVWYEPDGEGSVVERESMFRGVNTSLQRGGEHVDWWFILMTPNRL